MEINDIWARIENLPSLISKITSKDQNALNELGFLWKVTTGNTLRWDCRDCRIRAYREVTSLTYEQLITMDQKKFILKPGVLVTRGHEDFTAASMTDEIAEQIIKDNPKNLELFLDYPKNADGEYEAPTPVEDNQDNGNDNQGEDNQDNGNDNQGEDNQDNGNDNQGEDANQDKYSEEVLKTAYQDQGNVYVIIEGKPKKVSKADQKALDIEIAFLPTKE